MSFWSAIRAVFRVLPKAAEDLQANAPRPAQAVPAMTREQAIAALDEAKADLARAQAWLAANPGALTAFDRLLAALAAENVAWAASARAGLARGPDALAKASAALPIIEGFLKETTPAPVGIPGAWSGARGHVW